MNTPKNSAWTEESILDLLEADPGEPEVQARLSTLEADPEASALARSLSEVELGLSTAAFKAAEAAVAEEYQGGLAPALDPAQERALLDIPGPETLQAPKPSWFKGLFSKGQAPAARDIGGGPSPQMTILITMAALIFVIVGFKRLFQDAPPAKSSAEISRMKGGLDEGLVLTVMTKGAGDETEAIPLRSKGNGTWEGRVPLDASFQVMVEGPRNVSAGETWTAKGDLQWRFPGGNTVPVLGPEGLTLQGEGPNWSGPATKPISLPALKARGFGEGHQLVLSLSSGDDTQRVVIIPGAPEGP